MTFVPTSILQNELPRLLLASVIAATLTACGGGGGGTTTSVTTPATSTPSAASLVSTVPAATYSGEQLIAFNLINAERNTCGFGLLTQSIKLDGIALSHAAYSSTNGTFAHEETAGMPGFSGVLPTDRAGRAGYSGTVGEVMAIGNGNIAVRGLLSAPYHLRGLMDGYRDIGIGMLASSIPDFPYFVADLGTQTGAGQQMLGSADVVTYPCDGSAGVNYQLRGETPNPVPGRNLSANPIGTPVLVKVRDGNVLQVTSASMINKATGAAVALRAPVGAANDPNTVNGIAYFRASEAYVAPDVALQPGTAYQVTIAGTNNGAAFSRTFTFTTGTGVN